MKHSTIHSSTRRASALALLVALLALGVLPGRVEAQPTDASGINLIGEIEHIFLDDPSDYWSSGTIIVNGSPVIVPRNLLIDLPANRLSLKQLFDDAPPACLAVGESGLAESDTCRNKEPGAHATILANRTASGHLIAGDVFIAKAANGEVAGALVPDVVGGAVSYVDHDQGYFVLNGFPNTPPTEDGGPADNPGIIVRWNDPEQVHSIQQGLGCDGGPNCSPDVRFTNDPENYTIVGTTGYPLCIPSTVTGIGARTVGADPVTGAGDEWCPMTNRNLGGPSGREVPDSTRYFPLAVGDNVGGEGNWETVNGVRFFSCHTFTLMRKLQTRPTADQPDFLTMAEVEWDAAGYANRRAKALFIGFSTLDSSQVDIFALHVDPETGENQEFILGSTVGNLDSTNQGVAPNAGGIFKIGYDVDFDLGAPVRADVSPCQRLLNAGFPVCPNGGTMDEEMALLTPITREVQVYSRHLQTLLPGVTVRNIVGDAWAHGQYLTPIGVGHPEFVEVDLNRISTPFIFAGEPWNLDRRLGPGGCLDAVGTENCGVAPMGSHALDPFPYSGLDPRTQANIPALSANRIFGHFPFGAGDLLPWPPLTLPNPTFLSFAFAASPGRNCDIPNQLPVAQDDNDAFTVTDEDTPLGIFAADLLLNDQDGDFDTLEIFRVDAASSEGGSIVDHGDGTFTYTPRTDFEGTDTFTYAVTDGHGGEDIARVTVTVNPVNDAPVAIADAMLTPVDLQLSFVAADLLANDTDLEGDLLTVVAVDATSSAGGTIVVDGAGWLYSPPAAFAAEDTFGYTIADPSGATASGTVSVFVGNDAPTAIDDPASGLEDTRLDLVVVANDTDPNGDPLSVVSFTQGALGTITQVSPTTLAFQPAPNVSGIDTFSYTITDGRGGVATATVTLDVLPTNDAPVAISDFAVVEEDGSVLIAVLENDRDAEDEVLTLLAASQPFSGTTTVVGNSVRYEPLPNIALPLPDTFSYTVRDATGATSIGTVSVSVTPINDAPIATSDLALTLEDQPVTFNALLNDTDIENDTLAIESVIVPPGFPAEVTFTAAGEITIVPEPNFFDEAGVNLQTVVTDGRASSTSTVTFIVLPVNDVPVAGDDLALVTDEDTPLTIDVLANDFDQDADPLAILSTGAPLHGVVAITAGGQLLYTPTPDSFGPELFTYTVTDNQGGVATATVALDVVPVSDAPFAGADGPVPLAEDTAKTVNTTLLFANDGDVDGDAIELVAVGTPANGTVSLIGAPATGFLYTPAPNFFGTDTVTYTVADPSGLTATATVTLNVLGVNDAPIAVGDFVTLDEDTSLTYDVTLNDIDLDGDTLSIAELLVPPSHGSLSFVGGTITYVPTAGYFGTDHAVLQISDGNGGLATSDLDLTIFEVVPPFADMVRGDANGDGAINVADPIATLTVLFGSVEASCAAAHDANDDEQIDVSDIIFSLNYVFAGGAQPAAPFPFCGGDPTPGTLPCVNFVACP